jgi:hypothetical protein
MYLVDRAKLGFGIFAPLMRQEGEKAAWWHVEQLLWCVSGKPLHTQFFTASGLSTDVAVQLFGLIPRREVLEQKFEAVLL